MPYSLRGGIGCFTLGQDDCALVAVAEIEKAQKTLEIEQFQLTESRIGKAIIDAENRGVAVRLVVDKKAPTEKNGQTPASASAGIPVWVDSKPHIAHNKVVIVDHTTVIGGSFNLTSNADHWNSENLTVIRDPQWAAAYEQNFENRLAASETLTTYQAAHQK
jgi:phosphatidylserine/phosphatidylglycerophosphate/cardiolipin synthase-like enzyme